MRGEIEIAGTAVGSSARIVGDLTGQLIAGAFGNVVVVGSFTGQIGDAGTAPGVGNVFRIAKPGGGGTLQPSDAIFATRIGYP